MFNFDDDCLENVDAYISSGDCSASQNDRNCSDDDVLIRSKRHRRRATSSSILMPFDGVACALNSDSHGQTSAVSSTSDDSDDDGEALDDVLECIICRESLCQSLDVEIGLLKRCMHIFCFACINCWATRATVCPLCKREFDKIYKAKTSQLSKLDGGRLVTSSRGKLRKCVGPAKTLVCIRNIFDKVPWTICHVKPKQLTCEAADDDLDVTACEVCAQDNDEERMLLCDACDLGFHLYCLNPPLDAVPSGDWFCPNCAEARGVGGGNVSGSVVAGGGTTTRGRGQPRARTGGGSGRRRRRRRRSSIRRGFERRLLDGYGAAAATREARRRNPGESGAAYLSVDVGTLRSGTTTATATATANRHGGSNSRVRGATSNESQDRRITRAIASVQRLTTRPSTISISSSDSVTFTSTTTTNFRNTIGTSTSCVNRNSTSLATNTNNITTTSVFTSNGAARQPRVESRLALSRLDVDGLIRRITSNLNAAARQQGQGALYTTNANRPCTASTSANARASSASATSSTSQRHTSFTYRYRTLLGSDLRGSASNANIGPRANGNSNASFLLDAQQRVSITGSTVKYLV